MSAYNKGFFFFVLIKYLKVIEIKKEKTREIVNKTNFDKIPQ